MRILSTCADSVVGHSDVWVGVVSVTDTVLCRRVSHCSLAT